MILQNYFAYISDQKLNILNINKHVWNRFPLKGKSEQWFDAIGDDLMWFLSTEQDVIYAFRYDISDSTKPGCIGSIPVKKYPEEKDLEITDLLKYPFSVLTRMCLDINESEFKSQVIQSFKLKHLFHIKRFYRNEILKFLVKYNIDFKEFFTMAELYIFFFTNRKHEIRKN